MEEALAQAGVSPSDVDYLETHATGSQLGDPIELNAAASVYGKGRDEDRPLLVGTVKSNIGHLEWAAGIAAFIKAVLSMNNGVIPPHLHYQDPNPNFEWDRMPVRVTSDRTAWPTNSGRPPLAGVNAFGLSGTNAHVLVEGYGGSSGDGVETIGSGLPIGDPQPIPVAPSEQAGDVSTSGEGTMERTVRLLPLSGKSDGALRELAKRYLSWLDGAEGRASDSVLSDLAWTAGVGRSHFPHRAGLVFSDVEQLLRKLRALADTDDASDREVPDEAAKAAFAYTGNGSQWGGMGEALYRSEPVARAILDRCDDLIRQERGVSLLDVMFGRSGIERDLNDPAWAEPVMYALQCALTAQWASVGIRPNAVVVGNGSGALAAAQAAGVLGLEEGLRLATALGDVKGTRSDEDTQASRESLEAALAGIAVAAPTASLVSSATGQLLNSGDTPDLEDWFRVDSEPAPLSGCSETLAQLGVGIVVEIGPEAESPESDDSFVKAVAGAYEAGLDISFAGLFAGEARRRIALPTYPFQRRRHWI